MFVLLKNSSNKCFFPFTLLTMAYDHTDAFLKITLHLEVAVALTQKCKAIVLELYFAKNAFRKEMMWSCGHDAFLQFEQSMHHPCTIDETFVV